MHCAWLSERQAIKLTHNCPIFFLPSVCMWEFLWFILFSSQFIFSLWAYTSSCSLLFNVHSVELNVRPKIRKSISSWHRAHRLTFVVKIVPMRRWMTNQCKNTLRLVRFGSNGHEFGPDKSDRIRKQNHISNSNIIITGEEWN